MNRTTLAFASVLALISSSHAVDLTGTITGAPGSPGTNISSVADLNISSATVQGGAAVEDLQSSIIANSGQDGIQIVDVSQISIINSTFKGSGAGNSTSANINALRAIGGDGIDLRGTFGIDELGSGVVMQGGNGGNAENGNGKAKAFGGNGMLVDTLSAFDLTISGGSYSGGNGGSATFNSTEEIYPFSEVNYFGEYSGQIGGINGASGGDGIRIYNTDYIQYGTTVTIDGGTFSGGNGGTSINNGTGDSDASGGHGIFTDFLDIVINGGDFSGGAGGTANGVAGDAGYGLLMRDGNLTVTDGNFHGNSIWVESHYYDTVVDISGGTFGDVNLVARYDEFYADPNRTTTSDISGGTFDSITLMAMGDVTGAATESSYNNATISDATIGTLAFSGTSDASVNTVTIDPSASISSVYQDGGTANVELWSAAQMQDVSIADGTMNFNNIEFTLDKMFALESETAAANFNSGLTVGSGGSLHLGLGTVGGSDIVLENGAKINSLYDGSSVGSISSSGTLDIEDGIMWTIDIGTNAVLNGTEFDVATAGTLVTNITTEAFRFAGAGGESGWLGGVNDLTSAGNTLTVTYGPGAIDAALGVDGDTSTEFGKAMNALATEIPPGSDGYNTITELAPSAAAGGWLMTNAYVRTTEMASTLVGLQAMISDQIQNRVRSQMQFDEVGYPNPSSPSGAAGWDSMRRLSDNMESAISLDGIREWGDRMEDTYGYAQVRDFANNAAPESNVDSVALPEHWQMWGRGYASFIEQDDNAGFAGYDADVAGGMIGIDKSVNNLLLGVGAGYARTDLQGNEQRDAIGDTGNAVAYFATHGERGYLNASASYAYNAVETDYSTMGYAGKYDAHTAGLFIGGGYGLSLMDRVLLTPEASILNTLYMRDSYTERSSLAGIPAVSYDSYDQWSHLAQLGATLNTIQRFSMYRWEMGVQPELRVHWLHEFNADWDDETYVMGGSTIGATPMAREEDLVKVGAGLRLTSWAEDTTEIGVDLDGTFGQDGYDAYILSGKIMHRF